MPWLLTVAAVVIAYQLAEASVFKRITLVISDQISRALGARDARHVVLVCLSRPFSNSALQPLLSGAIPALLNTYQAAAVGVDIDFSNGSYRDLARDFSEWSTKNSESAKRVVWAVAHANEQRGTVRRQLPDAEAAFCEQCSGVECKVRFTPLPVFGSGSNPSNYGLSIAFPDADGVNRASLRFVCHSDSEKPLKAFHFRLVELYCDGRPDVATCRYLTRDRQARTTIFSWYDAPAIDLCRLVNCPEAASDIEPVQPVGGKLREPALDGNILAGKIVLLYTDVPRDDEHLTMAGTQKGAEMVASLIENELQFGVAPEWHVKALEGVLEAIIILVLAGLFHWRHTERWAILPASSLFVVYLHFIPGLATWVPDFRNFVLAIILSFWVEVLLKLGWRHLR